MIVADTNLIAYLFISGERTEAARRVWEKDPDWRMPPLWRSEFLSVLTTAVRSGVLSEAQAIETWHNAVGALGRMEYSPSGEKILKAAFKYDISAYDAQFVAVAQDLGARLVTGDKRILKNCVKTAVSIEIFCGVDPIANAR